MRLHLPGYLLAERDLLIGDLPARCSLLVLVKPGELSPERVSKLEVDRTALLVGSHRLGTEV